MATTLHDLVSVPSITAQAKEIHPGRTILTWIAIDLFVLGWATSKVAQVPWLVGAWSFVAVREGWREARSTGGAARPG